MATVRDQLETTLAMRGGPEFAQQMTKAADVTGRMATAQEKLNQILARQRQQQENAATTAGNLTNSIRNLAAQYLAFQTVIQTVRGAINEASDAERRLFETQLVLSNLGRREFLPVLVDMATELSRLSAIDDDLLITSGKLLAQFGLTDQQIRRALPTLTDFARAQNIGIVEATQLAERGILGQSRALKLWTGDLKLGTDTAKNFEIVMRALERASRGTAAAFRQTLPGSQEALARSREDLLKAVGQRGRGSTIAVQEGITLLQDRLRQRVEGGGADFPLRTGEAFEELGRRLRAGEPLFSLREGGVRAGSRAAREAAAAARLGAGEKPATENEQKKQTAALEDMADKLISNVLGGAGEAARRALNIRAVRTAFRNGT